MTAYEWSDILISAFTAAISLGGLAFVGIQVRQARVAGQEDAVKQEAEWERQRKAATISAVTSVRRYREELAERLPWNDRDAEAVTRFLEKSHTEPEIKVALRSYLNVYEDLAVGVHVGVLDEATLFRLTGGSIIAIAQNYKAYIDEIRVELKSDSIYKELGTLAAEMTVRRIRTRPS